MDKAYFTDGGISSNPLHLEAVPWNGVEENYLDQGLPVVEHFPHFDSSFSSGISQSPMGGDAFLLPEIMGRQQGFGNQFVGVTDDSSGKMNLPPLALPSPGSGLAERAAAAAKYSLLGSRSFKGRSMNNVELGQRSSISVLGNTKLSRVCSSPALNHGGSLPVKQISTQIRRGSGIVSASEVQSRKVPRLMSSNNDSSVSEQIQSAETGPKISSEMNSKDVRACKRDEDGTPLFKCQDGANLKRLKPEEEPKRDSHSNEKQNTNQKPPEPPKDYIHVRARRGQATDSHSLAERVRREKISERMKLLQDLVPGCNKVTGKALMLDEIINYVQSLQRQVEFLSMKLASVNPGLDFNSENRVAKEIYPLISPSFHHHHHQFHQTSPPPLDSFTHSIPPTLPSFNEDDIQSIVLMGFAQDPAFNPPSN